MQTRRFVVPIVNAHVEFTSFLASIRTRVRGGAIVESSWYNEANLKRIYINQATADLIINRVRAKRWASNQHGVVASFHQHKFFLNNDLEDHVFCLEYKVRQAAIDDSGFPGSLTDSSRNATHNIRGALAIDRPYAKL